VDGWMDGWMDACMAGTCSRNEQIENFELEGRDNLGDLGVDGS